MFEKFVPDYVFDGIFDIPVSFFRSLDIRAVILDIDNTLVPDGEPLPDKRVSEYISGLKKAGIAVAIASNNKRERVVDFVTELGGGISYSYKSGKPKKSSLTLVMASFPCTSSHVALVGDQILTDIIAAKSNGIMAIYVKPIDTSIETNFFRVKRVLERPFLKRYYKKRSINGNG